MMLSRRQLIKICAAVGISSGIGISALGFRWWDVPAGVPYRKMSIEEATVLTIIAHAAFPPGPIIAQNANDLKIDRFFDHLLSNMPMVQTKLLKLLLNALNTAPYLEIKSSLSSQSSIEQQEQVEKWLNHPNYLFRNAVTSLVILIGMGYTAHPEVSPYFSQMHQCGYGVQ